jgi:hypothetical protein
MAANSPVTQKELAEVNKELKELRKDVDDIYGLMGGLRKDIESKHAEHNNLIMDRAKAIGDLGVKVQALEQQIKKVEKDNWL